MSQTTNELKQEVKKSLAHLQTLRDEVRVKLHLAGMDAKERWNKLEPRITEVENEIDRAADEVSETSRAALNDVIKRVRHLLDSLK